MATTIDFPSNPQINDIYIYGQITYIWDGTSWYVPGSLASMKEAVPINGIVQFNRTDPKFTDTEGRVWLNAGEIETDLTTYPDAVIKDYPLPTTLKNISPTVLITGNYSIYITNNGEYFLEGNTVNTYLHKMSTPYMLDTMVISSTNTTNIPSYYGIALSENGTKVYTGANGNLLNQYTLSTPFNLTTRGSVTSFNVSAQITNIQTIYFEPNGTKVFIGGSASIVYQYNMSVPWDITTCTYITSLSVAVGAIKDISWSLNGLYLYVYGETSTTLKQYTSTTPFNLSGITYTRETQNLSTNRMRILDDGVGKSFVGSVNSKLRLYISSISYNISTLKEWGVLLPPTGNVLDAVFSANGLRAIVSTTTSYLYEYTLTEPYILSSGTYTGTSVSLYDDITPSFSPPLLYLRKNGLELVVAANLLSNQYVWIVTLLSDCVLTGRVGVGVNQSNSSENTVYYDSSGNYSFHRLTGSFTDARIEKRAIFANNKVIQKCFYGGGTDYAWQPTGDLPVGLFYSPDGKYLTLIRNSVTVQYTLKNNWDLTPLIPVDIYNGDLQNLKYLTADLCFNLGNYFKIPKIITLDPTESLGLNSYLRIK